jgi:hypothetical protein
MGKQCEWNNEHHDGDIRERVLIDSVSGTVMRDLKICSVCRGDIMDDYEQGGRYYIEIPE